MKLYYTGANTYGTYQNSPILSLGGFISSTIVPNSLLGNLFPEISKYSMENGESEVRAVILRNTTGAAINNVYISHTYPVSDQKAKIEWSPVTIPDGKSMEKVSSPYSEPYNIAGWFEPIGDLNKILIANSMADDGVIGLWVKRTVFSPNPADLILGKDLAEYNANLVKTEEIAVNISWD